MKALAPLFAAAVVAHGSAAQAPHEHPAPAVLAPGYTELEYQPPAAGSYALPPLGIAADGAVIEATGLPTRLHALFDGKLVVLSFIFTRCSDVNGCSLASFVLRSVQDRLLEDAELRDQVRLLSVSFDPTYDTPAVLERYAGYFRKPGFDWRFLTTPSEDQLAPILHAYDQWVQRDVDAAGAPLGNFSHILRVFLIDRDKRIRNIYTVSFLHADTVLNDLRTLARAGGPR
jgi:cytochrome oxidase Cu insertion factor (SCO1/SenC/PrrC family)